jgi:hypothetical protein
MKTKILATIFLTGFFSFGVNAGTNQFNAVDGGMNVLNLSGGYETTITPFGLADLRSLTTNNLTFTMMPNINLYEDDVNFRGNSGAGPDGAKILEQFTLWEMAPTKDIQFTPDITSVVFEFDVDAFDLDTSRYTLTAFAKVLNPASDYSESIADRMTITGTSTGNNITISTLGLGGQLLQVGWNLKGQNANPVESNTYGSATVTLTDLYAQSSDFTAPTPEYMTFAVNPVAVNDSQITMTAAPATDNIYGVEYMFSNMVNQVVSGWQKSTNYTETGLSPGATYSYVVKARDLGINANENFWSAPESATTTGEDTVSPTPDSMSFVGTDVGTSMIKLTAATAFDASGVEYYFECVDGPGNDSGWQESPVYYDTGLPPGSNYSYTVIARDRAAAQNSNTVSAVTNLATLAVESGAFTNSLTGLSGDTDDLDIILELNKIGLTTGSENAKALISFGVNGATFGDLTTSPISETRDVIKTVADGYANVSVEAYATFTFAGNSDLSGFLGIGQGLVTGTPPNYGVPELNLSGVNGIVAQFKDSTAGSGVYKCNLFKFVSGNPAGAEGEELLTNPIGSTETIRARLIYDSVAETVNVSFDKGYSGGEFAADQDMGTVSTALTNGVSIWEGAPVRVYVGGGEGTLVKDFEIVVTYVPPPPQPPFDVQPAGAVLGGGMILMWNSVSGRTYELQYKTNLVTDLEWTTDPSLGAAGISSDGGSISATSTVDSASIFYRIISQ